MTLNNSTNKYNPFLHNIITNVKNNKTVLIIIGVLHLLSFPAIIISQMINFATGKDCYPDSGYLVLAVCLTVIAGVAGIVIVAQNFTYLSSKTKVDMQLSLPLTKKQKFLSDYISGLISYIGPFIVTQVISLVLLTIGAIFIEGKEMPENYVNRDFTPICNFYAEAFPVFWKVLLIGTLTMLFLYTLTVLVAVCCGTKAENVIYNILINGAIPASIASLLIAWENNTINILPAVIRTLAYTSPVGGIVVAVMSINDYATNYEGHFETIELLPWAIMYTLVIAGIFMLSYRLYQKRTAEKTSQSFAFSFLFYLITFLIIFAIVALTNSIFGYGDFGTAFIVTGIFTFVFYMILHTIKNRSLKKWWKGMLAYLATIVAASVLIMIVPATNFFGRLYYVPSVDSTNAVYLNGNSFDNFLPYDIGWCDGFNYVKDGDKLMENIDVMKFTDAKNIELITKIHQSSCEILKEGDPNHYDFTNADAIEKKYTYYTLRDDISYEISGNNYVTREIDYVSTNFTEDIKTLITSDEYKQNIIRILTEKMADSYASPDLYRYEYGSDYNATLHLRLPTTQEDIGFNIDDDFNDKFVEAFEKDLAIFDYNDPKYFENQAYELEIKYDYIVEIPAAFENCVNVLADYVDLDILNDKASFEYNFANALIAGDSIYIEEPELSFTLNGKDYYTNLARRFDIKDTKSIDFEYVSYDLTEQDYADLQMLALVSSDYSYISNEECYTIYVDGVLRLIPTEYSEIAKRLYDKQEKSYYPLYNEDYEYIMNYPESVEVYVD